MKKKSITHIVFVIITISLMIFIYCNSAATGTESGSLSDAVVAWFNQTLGIPVTSFIVRKTAHFLEFAALGFSLHFACFNKKPIAIAIGIVYAMSDEFHQLFVPGRACQFRDVLIDSAGVVCGVLVAWAIFYCFNHKKSI